MPQVWLLLVKLYYTHAASAEHPTQRAKENEVVDARTSTCTKRNGSNDHTRELGHAELTKQRGAMKTEVKSYGWKNKQTKKQKNSGGGKSDGEETRAAARTSLTNREDDNMAKQRKPAA